MSQRILVTGANRGIGLALVAELLGSGHTVVAAARQQSQELKQLEAIHHDRLFMVQMDVNSDDSVAGAAKAVGNEVPALDLAVNNAAVFPEDGTEPLAQMKLQYFRNAFETNVLGVVRVSLAFLPLLQKGDSPRIVNISSGAGLTAHKDDSRYYAYSVSKAALNMLTRAMAAEFRAQNICVVAMSPGWVRTEMGGPNAPLSPEDSARSLAGTILRLSMEKTSRFLDRDGSVNDSGW